MTRAELEERINIVFSAITRIRSGLDLAKDNFIHLEFSTDIINALERQVNMLRDYAVHQAAEVERTLSDEKSEGEHGF